MTDLDWNAIDHFEEVAEHLNIDLEKFSLQERAEMGQKLLQMAALRLAAEQQP